MSEKFQRSVDHEASYSEAHKLHCPQAKPCRGGGQEAGEFLNERICLSDHDEATRVTVMTL